MTTRHDARAYWRESGVQLEDITPADLRALRKRLDFEMQAHGGKIAMKTTKAARAQHGGVEVRCAGYHFEDREALTFYPRDGDYAQPGIQVGFAGWADDENIQPILRGFMCWLAERQGRLRKSFIIWRRRDDGRSTVFAPGTDRRPVSLPRNAQAVRNYAGDIVLPFRHRLAADLSANDLRVLTHAYGGGVEFREGYRDHFWTSAGDLRILRLAWEFGLFHNPTRAFGMACYHLTELGRRVAAGEIKTYPGYV